MLGGLFRLGILPGCLLGLVLLPGCNSETDVNLLLKAEGSPTCAHVEAFPPLAQSKNGGANFTRSYPIIPSGNHAQLPQLKLAASPAQPGLLYEMNINTVDISTDAGCNWEVAHARLLGDPGPGFLDLQVTADRAFVLEGREEWTIAIHEIHANGSAESVALPQGLPQADISIAATSDDPAALYLFGAGGDYALWRRDPASGSWSVQADGIPAGNRLVAINPRDARHMLMSTDDGGAIVSFDGGTTWNAVILPEGTATEARFIDAIFEFDGSGAWVKLQRRWLDPDTAAELDSERVLAHSNDGGNSFQEAFVFEDEDVRPGQWAVRPGASSEIFLTEGSNCRTDERARVHRYSATSGRLATDTHSLSLVHSFGAILFSPFNRDVAHAVELFEGNCETTR